MPLSPIQDEVYDAVIVDKTLLDALLKTLDAMSTTMCVLLPIAAIVIWAALTKKTFKIGDFEFELSNAFWPVLLVFVGANLVLLFNLVQLGSALQRLTTASVEEGITRIWYHSWVLNPFCYFGDETTERTACLFGYGSLILAWWVCFLAVASLLNYRQPEKSKSEDNEVQEIRTITQLPLLIPITTGLGAMAAIGRVYKIIGLRGNEVHGIPIAAFQASLPTRETIGLVAIAVGLMIFVLMENRLLRQAGMQRLGFSKLAQLAGVAGSSFSAPLNWLLLKAALVGVATLATIPWVRSLYSQHYWSFIIIGLFICAIFLFTKQVIGKQEFQSLFDDYEKDDHF